MWRWWEEASEDRYRGIGKERKKARERKRRAVLRASRSTVKMTSQMHELERFLSRGMLICSPLVESTAWYYERCIQFNWPKPMHFSKPEHSNAEYFTPQPSCILHWSAVSLCTREGGVSFMLYVLSFSIFNMLHSISSPHSQLREKADESRLPPSWSHLHLSFERGSGSAATPGLSLALVPSMPFRFHSVC